MKAVLGTIASQSTLFFLPVKENAQAKKELYERAREGGLLVYELNVP